MSQHVLPDPPQYFPWQKGTYDVSPNLKLLGTDFGNGSMDSKAFQIDTDFPRFHQSKLQCYAENSGRYVVEEELSDEVAQRSAHWMADRLTVEYPALFVRDGALLKCALTENQVSLNGPPLTVLSQLCLEVQEDLAIVRVSPDRDWTAYLNVCSPSHWAPESKIGASFVQMHDPVPGFKKIIPAAPGLVKAMIEKGPFVRFVWTITSDKRLNHHPAPLPGWDPDEWMGRDFSKGQFWVRTERQVLIPLPEVSAGLFWIRVGYVSEDHIRANPALLNSLRSNLHGMTPEIRAYKGLEKRWTQMMTLIDN